MPALRRVQVVTDSTADLPPDLVARWGIVVVPLYVHFGEESFRDGMDLSLEAFLERLARGEHPTTSQPSVGAFKRAFQQLAAGGGEVISLHLASSLSGTCEAAMLAADQADGRVVVVDTGLFSMALGWLVLAAVRAARAGCTLDEIVALVEEMKGRIFVPALLEDLEALRRGGRIGRVRQVAGSLLNIRPIITVREGEVLLLERVRTRRAGLRRLVEMVAAAGPLEQVAVVHAGVPQLAEQVADALAPVFPREQMLVTAAGQVTIAHVGAGAVGVAYVVAGR